MKRLFIILSAMVLVCACGTTSGLTRGSQYSKMYEEKPLTLLVMPPINNTTNVEAKEYLYTSISRPLAEAGYYVISPMLAMDVLKAESAYDAELFLEGSLEPFRRYFGADAVVFSIIETWAKQGFGIRTNLKYIIKSTTSGEILFERSCNLFLDLSVKTNNSENTWLSLLADVALSAVNTAATDHITAARKANYYIFRDIPRGKYSPLYLTDMEYSADKKDIEASVK